MCGLLSWCEKTYTCVDPPRHWDPESDGEEPWWIELWSDEGRENLVDDALDNVEGPEIPVAEDVRDAADNVEDFLNQDIQELDKDNTDTFCSVVGIEEFNDVGLLDIARVCDAFPWCEWVEDDSCRGIGCILGVIDDREYKAGSCEGIHQDDIELLKDIDTDTIGGLLDSLAELAGVDVPEVPDYDEDDLRDDVGDEVLSYV